MTIETSEPLQSPEVSIVWTSPQELIENNRAAEVPNPGRKNMLVESFNPYEWRALDGVYVQTYSSEHNGYIVKLLLKDGMNRTFACRELNEEGKTYTVPTDITEPLPTSNFGSIPVRNVTTSQFTAYGLTPEAFDSNGNQILTVEQYQHLIVEPTLDHAIIADKRAAALFRAGWADMIGEEAAAQFTIPAALQLLSGRSNRVRFLTGQRLATHLQEFGPYTENETEESRGRVVRALVHTKTIMDDLKLNPEKVARAAFEQIVAGSPVIGGTSQIEEEIFKQLDNYTVMTRLTQQFSQIEAERKREEIGSTIYRTIGRIAEDQDKTEALQTIFDAIISDRFSYDECLDIASHESPVERYNELVREIHTRAIAEEYKQEAQISDLSEVEEIILNNIGGLRYLSSRDIQNTVRAIRSGSTTVNQARKYFELISQTRDTLIAKGVKEELINTALQSISETIDHVLQSTTSNMVQSRTKDLLDLIRNTQERVRYQSTITAVDAVVEGIYGDSPTINFGRNDIVFHLERLVRSNAYTLDQIANYTQRLKSLDNDFQLSVLRDRLSLSQALDRQEERRKREKVQNLIEKGRPSTTIDSDTKPRTSVEAILPTQPEEHEQSIIKKDSPAEPEQEDKKPALEENINKPILSTSTQLHRELDLVTADQLNNLTRQNLENLFNRIGQLLTGETNLNPITILTSYLEQIRKSNRELEERVQHDMTQIEEDKDNTKI